jgi:hypothetical protein
MSKRKNANPLENHAPYSDILGVDPSQIRQRVRRDRDTSESEAGDQPGELLTSKDLFGDILAKFPKSAPPTPERADAPTEEREREQEQEQEREAEAQSQSQSQSPPANGETPGEESSAAAAEEASDDSPEDIQTHSHTHTDGDAAASAAAEVDVDHAYANLLGDTELGVDASVLDENVLQYGDYCLLDRIGAGGMAEVFRATRRGAEGFEKIVAVKRILPHLSTNPAFVDEFVAEAKAAASLTHPNIAQILEVGEIEQSHFIAMEFVPGRDLRAILKRARDKGRRFDVDDATAIAMKLCAALECAHRHRSADGAELPIIHRDVSPQNVLISSEGDVKLVDFGIAKAAHKASHTDAASLRGKLLYMSPEQAAGETLDKRSDIFSLGVVLFEMLTGRVLFSGSSKISILERVRQAHFTRPSSLNEAVPHELEAVLTRALQKDRNDRYQDAGEMRIDLEAYQRLRPATTPESLTKFVGELFETPR